VKAKISDPDALWLELTFQGQSHPFALPPDETRAITVGSLEGADLRIARPGVAPVQFHIERDCDQLWIVPAYASEGLRVDTARVTGPKRIDGRAVLEFSGLRVQASVLQAPPPPAQRSCSRAIGSCESPSPAERIIPVAIHAVGETRLSPLGLPSERPAPPLQVRTQKRRPLLAWTVGALTVFVLFASAVKISKTPKPVGTATRIAQFDINLLRSASSPSVKAAFDQGLASAPGIIPTNSAAMPLKPKVGQPANSELVGAIEALVSGRYADAKLAYSRLSTSTTNTPAVQTVSALLTKKLSPRCSSASPPSNISCPEVKP